MQRALCLMKLSTSLGLLNLENSCPNWLCYQKMTRLDWRPALEQLEIISGLEGVLRSQKERLMWVSWA